METKLLLEKRLKEAVILCLENAEQYYQDAEILVAIRSYGHAFALTVLGEEEFGKAMIYYLFSQNLFPKDLLSEPFKSYLKKGQYGTLGKQYLAMGYALISGLDELVKDIVESIEMTRTRKKLETTIRGQNASKLAEKIRIGLDQFQKLQNKKESGLFVDFDVMNEISSPNLFKKSEVKEYLHQAKNRLELYKPFITLSLTPSQKSIVITHLKKIMNIGPKDLITMGGQDPN